MNVGCQAVWAEHRPIHYATEYKNLEDQRFLWTSWTWLTWSLDSIETPHLVYVFLLILILNQLVALLPGKKTLHPPGRRSADAHISCPCVKFSSAANQTLFCCHVFDTPIYVFRASPIRLIGCFRWKRQTTEETTEERRQKRDSGCESGTTRMRSSYSKRKDDWIIDSIILFSEFPSRAHPKQASTKTESALSNLQRLGTI